MAQDPVEGQPALRAQLTRHLERVRRGGVHAGPVVPAVDLEPDVQAGPRERLGGGQVVHQYAQRGPLGDAADVRDVGRVEGKRPGQVREPGPGHGLGLEQRRNREAAGAVGQLPLGQVDALVGLDVRSQGDAEATRALRHVREVPLDDVEVQEQCGGFGGDPVDHEGLRTRTRALLPIGTCRKRRYFTGLMA